MRRNGLRGRGKRRFRVAATDSNHALPVAPNLLARNFAAARPNTVWAGDMTHIPTGEGWLCLAAVLDLFRRRALCTLSSAGRWARRSRRSWPAAPSTWPGTAACLPKA